MKIDKEFRINCKCGVFLDSKTIQDEMTFDEVFEHMKHMYGGEKVNIFKILLNGKVQAMDYHTAFDEKYILEEVKSLLKKSEPDDIIQIINVSNNKRD